MDPPLFPRETAGRRLACAKRCAGCRTSAATTIRSSAPNRHSCGCFRQPGIGLDHHSRAFLALAVALRYEAESDAAFLRPARLLLDIETANHAEVLGIALRLAYTLSAGTKDLLAGTRLRHRRAPPGAAPARKQPACSPAKA